MALAQPISFDFSTNARLVAASKVITWMPAYAWRLASFALYVFQKSFWRS